MVQKVVTLAFGSGVVAAGVKWHNKRAAVKFYSSLMCISKTTMSDSYPYVQREISVSSYSNHAVIFQGPYRSGKTTFLAHSILQWYPWYLRPLFPPCGVFLQGNQTKESTLEWLKTQLSSTSAEDPVGSLVDLIGKRTEKQRFRVFLHTKFGDKLPMFLKPQPSLVIIDQAEELIRCYRTDFLRQIEPLVKYTRDKPHSLQLMFIVNSDTAVKSLESLNGGDLFINKQMPRPSLDAVRTAFQHSKECVDAFEKLDSCIGITHAYLQTKNVNNELKPAEFLQSYLSSYQETHGVLEVVSKSELAAALHPEAK